MNLEKLSKIKGRKNQFFTFISVSKAPNVLIAIIKIVEYKIWDNFCLIKFFIRLTVFEIEDRESAGVNVTMFLLTLAYHLMWGVESLVLFVQFLRKFFVGYPVVSIIHKI